jgi:cysteine synthase A
MREDLAAVFVAVGTGGLANAPVNFRQRFGLNYKIFAVDADGSCLARPPRHGARRRLSGYGNGKDTFLAAQVRPYLDHWIFVDDEEAVAMCHRVLRDQSLCVGPSSGAVLAAIEKMTTWRSHVLPKTGNVVAILPDGGEPYSQTVFNPSWLRRNGLGGFLNT